MILVVDFGSQVAHLIARKIRELNVYSELIPHTISIDKIIAKNPCGIILSGGPSSVYEKNAPLLKKEILNLNIPILGICYGHQLITKLCEGIVAKGKGEYGKTHISLQHFDGILKGLEKEEVVWMSHSDQVKEAPDNFQVTSISENGYISSIECPTRKIYSVQFHPEVYHTPNGKKILDNFLNIAQCPRNWSLEGFIEKTITDIKVKVGDKKVIMGVSGGVDSTVAAKLIQKAIGDNITGIFVNNGLLRKGEFEEVRSYFSDSDFKLQAIDSTEKFLARLKNVVDPEKKRKIIGNLFIEIFEQKAKDLGKFAFLGQGTIYPDRIESAEPSSQASVIKSHHNVGGLPDKMDLILCEPLRDLYKDEVRAVGKLLGISQKLLNRHPFPGPGLGIRIVGEITEDRLRIVRESDYILKEELEKENKYHSLWQSFTAFLDVKTVGVMGDARTYQYPIVIRCVDSIDAMTANSTSIPIEILKRIGSRIVNEVDGINRVFYDLTDKPPSTIEYE